METTTRIGNTQGRYTLQVTAIEQGELVVDLLTGIVAALGNYRDVATLAIQTAPPDAQTVLYKAIQAIDCAERLFLIELRVVVRSAKSDASHAAVTRQTPRLSQRELEVARLAAIGKRNKEIARALFITQNTVQSHMTHICDKLDIRSRGELAPIMNALEEVAR